MRRWRNGRPTRAEESLCAHHCARKDTRFTKMWLSHPPPPPPPPPLLRDFLTPLVTSSPLDFLSLPLQSELWRVGGWEKTLFSLCAVNISSNQGVRLQSSALISASPSLRRTSKHRMRKMSRVSGRERERQSLPLSVRGRRVFKCLYLHLKTRMTVEIWNMLVFSHVWSCESKLMYFLFYLLHTLYIQSMVTLLFHNHALTFGTTAPIMLFDKIKLYRTNFLYDPEFKPLPMCDLGTLFYPLYSW